MLHINGKHTCDAETGTYRNWHTCNAKAKVGILSASGLHLHYCERHRSHIGNPVYMTKAPLATEYDLDQLILIS